MKNGSKYCPKSCFISLIAVFIFLFAYDWVVHTMILMDDYQKTPEAWRSVESMKEVNHWLWVYYVALAMVLTCFFKKFRCAMPSICDAGGKPSCCPIKSGGLCFGIKVGLIMGLMHASSYIWMPISGDIAVKWFIAYLVQGIGAGVILGMLYKPASCDASQPPSNS